jgi:hypothetical protein
MTTSVAPVQPGGPASSVEHVDGIGSSFHSWQRRVLQLPLAGIKYLPRARVCEPHANWTFANAQVSRADGRELHLLVIRAALPAPRVAPA